MLIVTAHNDGTGPDDAANYDVTVYVNRVIIAQCRVVGHNRAHGWRGLLALIAKLPENSEVNTLLDTAQDAIFSLT